MPTLRDLEVGKFGVASARDKANMVLNEANHAFMMISRDNKEIPPP